MAYATRDDVHLRAISLAAFVSRARPFDAIDTATGIITWKANGLTSSDFVTFEVTSGGSLPTGISPGTPYAVEPAAFDSFRVINPATSATINWYVDGGSGWSIAVDMVRRLTACLESAAGIIDDHLTAHNPPLATPYPPQVVLLNARIAARMALVSLEFENAEYRVAAERLFNQEAADEKLLATWQGGKPVHPRPTDQDTAPNNGARAGRSRKASAWTTGQIW